MKLLKSLLILTLVSSAISLLFCSGFTSFAKIFCVSIIVQIFLYQIYLKLVKMYYDKLMVDKINAYSKQGMEVTCPCYKESKMFIPIRLNGVNDYKCLECSKNVSVNLEAKTFLVTEPVDGDHIDSALLEAIEKIKNKPE